MMDSYDVRKATNCVVLVCTGYVGLYRGRWEPPSLVFSLFELFFPSSSFRDSRFPVVPPATHARERAQHAFLGAAPIERSVLRPPNGEGVP